jgi:hypothetical protein
MFVYWRSKSVTAKLIAPQMSHYTVPVLRGIRIVLINRWPEVTSSVCAYSCTFVFQEGRAIYITSA